MTALLAEIQPAKTIAINPGESLVALFALALVILLLIYPTMILRKYVRIMINILDEHAEVEDNGIARNGLPIVHATVSFTATDGHPLAGAILSAREQPPEAIPSGNGTNGRNGVNGHHAHHAPPPPLPYRGTVVFAHEFASVRTSCMRYCRPLLLVGYDVFTFDFRGHGESPPQDGYKPRQWASDREQADMQGAIRFITSHLRRKGLPQDIALLGVSRGAGAAILGSVGCQHVRAIITDGAFSSDTALEYLMRRFATVFARIRVVAENHPPVFWRFLRWLLFRECRRRFNCRFPSVRKAVTRLGRRPILFIHGEKDSYIPVAQSQLLYDRAVGPKSLWLVSGARHNCAVSVRADEYARRVLAFLDEHFPITSPATDIIVERLTPPLSNRRPFHEPPIAKPACADGAPALPAHAS